MIKECRKKASLTQEQVAEAIGIDIRNYQEIEAERAIPLASTFAKLVFTLKLSNEEIISLLTYYAKVNQKKGKKESK